MLAEGRPPHHWLPTQIRITASPGVTGPLVQLLFDALKPLMCLEFFVKRLIDDKTMGCSPSGNSVFLHFSRYLRIFNQCILDFVPWCE